MNAVSPKLLSDKPEWVAIDALTRSETKAAYAYWLRKRGERPMPRRTDIDPSEIRQLLPCLLIVDVLHETPPDYYFRIEGEAVRDAVGFRRAGRRLTEIKSLMNAEAYEWTVARLNAVCTEKLPKAQASTLAKIGRSFYEVEIVSLPLSDDGDRVDRIFQCIGFLKRPGVVPGP